MRLACLDLRRQVPIHIELLLHCVVLLQQVREVKRTERDIYSLLLPLYLYSERVDGQVPMHDELRVQLVKAEGDLADQPARFLLREPLHLPVPDVIAQCLIRVLGNEVGVLVFFEPVDKLDYEFALGRVLQHFKLVVGELEQRVIRRVSRHLLYFKDFLGVSVLGKPPLVDLVVGQFFLKLVLSNALLEALRSQ